MAEPWRVELPTVSARIGKDEFPTVLKNEVDMPASEGYLSGAGSWAQWTSSQTLTSQGLVAAPYVLPQGKRDHKP